MPKTKITFLTKPTSEIVSFISSVDKKDNESVLFFLKEFLSKKDDFGLLLYTFSSLASIALVKKIEENKLIEIRNFYFKNVEDVLSLLEYITARFNEYKIEIINTDLNSKIIKRYKTHIKTKEEKYYLGE